MDSIETTQEGTSQAWSQEQPQFIEIDWEQISIEDVKKWFLRQSDYTKKTQELAKQREEIERMRQWQQAPEQQEDEKVVDEYLKSKGYLTKSDFEKEKEALKQESYFDKFFDANPDLSKHEEAIRAIAKVDNSALEDIVVKYNFSTSDKLQKAKSSRSLVWDIKKDESNPKTIKTMTAAEYAKWKSEQWLSSKKWMFSD